jgi:acyl-CoA synthetase (AMP-forming)/AMP-acid ligase II
VDDETGSQLIIVAEVERNASDLSDEIRQAIRACLSLEHSLSVECIYLVKAGSMNKTSSGKIQRIACKQAMLHKALKRI